MTSSEKLKLPTGARLLTGIASAFFLTAAMAAAAPEIALSGRAFPILDGDSSPRTEDNTEFGTTTASAGLIRKVFVIANTGTTSLSVNEVSVDAPQFSVTILPQSSVPIDGVTSFEITYEPLTAGIHNATVTVTNDDADENPYTFAIRGIAKAPEIQIVGAGGLNINTGDTTPTIDDGTDFGTRTLQQVTEREFTITNGGEVNLEILSIGITPGPFIISQEPASSVVPGGSTKFKVRYLPTEPGSRSATITLLNNDLDEGTYTFSVRGFANEPEIGVFCNSIEIETGDLSPRLDDGTLFAPISYKLSIPNKSFLVRNTGTGILTINSVELSDAVNFRIASPLPASILANSSANLVVEYNPPTPGIHSATITINNNDLNEAPYVFGIRASTIVPTSNWGSLTNGDTSPTVEEGTDFGAGIIGAPPVERKYPISNGGPGTMVIESINISPGNQFSLPLGTTFPITIAPGTTYELPIRFAPTALGLHTATVNIEHNDPTKDPFVFDIKGTGNTRRALVGDPMNPIINGDSTPSLEDGTDLGFANLGATPLNKTIIPVKNEGNVPLTIDSIVLGDNVNFLVQNNPIGPIAPGATRNIEIAFNPQSGGLKNSTVTINSNDPTSPFVFSVRGYSRPVVAFAPTLVAAAPETRSQPLTNNTAAPMTVTALTIVPGTEFSYMGQALPFTLAPGQTYNLPIKYSPANNGVHNALVTVRTNADTSGFPFSFALTGSANKRLVVVGDGATLITSGDTTPSSVDGTLFTRVIVGVGAQVTRSWPVKNDGNVPLTIGSVELSNKVDFICTTNPTGSIAPGATGTLSLTFLPRTVGNKSSTVTIHSDDPRSPFVFTIGGEGAPRVDAENPDILDPTLTTVPWNPNFAGPYAAIIATPDANGRPTTPYGGGFESFSLKADGSFSAVGTFLDQKITIKGKIGPDGKYVGSTILPDGTLAVINLQTKTGSDGTSRIIGTLVHNGKTWVIEAIRALSGNIPANMIGKYTFAIPGVENTPDGEPSGDGVGNTTLRIDGRMTVKCRLADSNSFTMTSYITPRYQWMISKLVQRNDGRLSGIVRFRDVPNVSDFDGILYWNKTARSDHRYFKEGFKVTRNMVGCYYTERKGVSAISAMQLTGDNNAVFQIGSSAQGVPVSPKLINWGPDNRIRYTGPDVVGLRFIPSTGRISGNYTDFTSKSKVTIDGVILQKQNRAVGLIYNYEITGYISILPRQYTGF